MEGSMTIEYVPPHVLALLSDTIQAYCRQHDCDGSARVETANQAYRLFSEGHVHNDALLDRLNAWRQVSRLTSAAEAI
jgi:hypothetical protein